MKVLLLQDVDNVGLAGEVANVSSGYGRNYLLPQRLATLATEGALKRAEAVRKAGEARRAQEKADAEAIAGQIGGATVVFERRAGERGQLYGSVTSSDIAQKIQEEFDIDIDRRKLVLPEPLRSLGEFDVSIRLMIEVSTQVKVVVIEEGKVYVPSTATPEGTVSETQAEAEAEAAVETGPVDETPEEPVSEAETDSTEETTN